jgi:GTP-binding protein
VVAVLLQTGEGGQKLEPIEEVVAEVDDQYMGLVIEAMTLRKGELEEMLPDGAGPGRARLVFTCPSRGLIGYRSIFTMDTHGTGVMHRAFRE